MIKDVGSIGSDGRRHQSRVNKRVKFDTPHRSELIRSTLMGFTAVFYRSSETMPQKFRNKYRLTGRKTCLFYRSVDNITFGCFSLNRCIILCFYRFFFSITNRMFSITYFVSKEQKKIDYRSLSIGAIWVISILERCVRFYPVQTNPTFSENSDQTFLTF